MNKASEFEHHKYYAFYFILFFAWSSIYSLIAIYLNEGANFSLQEIGALMSILPIISLIFQPIWGAITDRTERKKRLLQMNIAVTLFLIILIPFLQSKLIIVLVYCAYQIFLCSQNPMTDSMAITSVNRTNSGSYGTIRVWGSIGYAIGSYAVAQIAFMTGLKAIFYIAAVGFLASILMLEKITEHPSTINRTNYLKDLGNLLREKNYVFILIYGFLFIGSFFGSEQYLGLFFRSHGIDVSKIGLLTFIAVCVESPLIFHSKKLIHIFGTKNLMLFMNTIAIIRLILLCFGSQWPLFVFTSVLRGILVGIFIPLFIEIVAKITPKELTTSAISIYSAVSTGIATFTFTYLGGIIADNLGYSYLYGIYSIIILIPLALAFTNKRAF